MLYIVVPKVMVQKEAKDKPNNYTYEFTKGNIQRSFKKIYLSNLEAAWKFKIYFIVHFWACSPGICGWN